MLIIAGFLSCSIVYAQVDIAPFRGSLPTPSANTQGTAVARTAAPVAVTTDRCSFNGVHDPFCGKTFAEIIGGVIQFLLGAAGALFLAMFVYGGTLWLTAGSSDRQEDAQKTLINASVGVIVVILSYTLVSLLVRTLGSVGVSQSNQGPRVEQTGTLPGAATPAAAGTGACNAATFITACHERCNSTIASIASLIPGEAATTAQCSNSCDSLGPRICSAVHSPAECDPGCTVVCSRPEISDNIVLSVLCTSECTDLCASAFPGS